MIDLGKSPGLRRTVEISLWGGSCTMRRLETKTQNSFNGDIMFFSEPLGEMTWWLKELLICVILSH